MPSTEESLKKLVGALIHDVRNHINGMVLELTDLRERWPDPRVTAETVPLMKQAMEMADRLRGIRERLDVPAPRPQRLPLSEAWQSIAPQARLINGLTAEAEIDIDQSQITLALAELVTNAIEASNGATLPQGRVDSGKLIIVVENPVDTEPKDLAQWGKLPGFTTRRRHLGLGCSFVRTVAQNHGGDCVWSYHAATRQVRAELSLPLALIGSPGHPCTKSQ